MFVVKFLNPCFILTPLMYINIFCLLAATIHRDSFACVHTWYRKPSFILILLIKTRFSGTASFAATIARLLKAWTDDFTINDCQLLRGAQTPHILLATKARPAMHQRVKEMAPRARAAVSF